MNFTKLLSNAASGDKAAVQELIRLQRNGKAMRLYPFGRKGPLDEGLTPLTIEPTNDLMVRFHLGHYSTILFPKKQLAEIMLHVLRLSVSMARHYKNRYVELESHATLGLGCHSHIAGENIALTLQPPGLLDYDLGLYHARKLLDNWTVLIEQNDWDHEDCGFTAEEYCDVLMFSDFESEI